MRSGRRKPRPKGARPPLRFWERPNVLAGWTAPSFEIGPLHNQVRRSPPVADKGAEPEKAVFNFNWLTATGTSVLLASVLSAVWLGISPKQFARTLWRTLRVLAWPLFTIAAMLAIAYATRFSGTDATLGLAFTTTGPLYPFFAPLLGWLGVALTGSDTSSNSLFGRSAKNHRHAAWPQPRIDSHLEQHRRRDGQDDRRPEHRRAAPRPPAKRAARREFSASSSGTASP